MDDTPTPPRYLKVSEAARHINADRSTIYRLCQRNEIEFVKLSKTSYRIPVDALDAWLARRTVPAVDVADAV